MDSEKGLPPAANDVVMVPYRASCAYIFVCFSIIQHDISRHGKICRTGLKNILSCPLKVYLYLLVHIVYFASTSILLLSFEFKRKEAEARFKRPFEVQFLLHNHGSEKRAWVFSCPGGYPPT